MKLRIPSDHLKHVSGYVFRNEISVPVGIRLKDVIGVRKGMPRQNNLLRAVSGPVFLRDGFERMDIDSFWNTLQIYAGKPQCIDNDRCLKELRKCQ